MCENLGPVLYGVFSFLSPILLEINPNWVRVTSTRGEVGRELCLIHLAGEMGAVEILHHDFIQSKPRLQ